MATQAAAGASIDIGRVVQRGFSTIGNQIGVFVSLALVLVGLPAVIMQFIVPAESLENPLALISTPLWWLGFVVSMITGFLLQASIVRAAIKDLKGERVDIPSNLLVAVELLLPMVGLTILVVLATAIGTMLLIVPGIIVYIMLIVSVPVLVEERRGIIGSMSRSMELTKGSRWHIFLLGVLIIIISLIVGGILGAVSGMVSMNSLLVAGVIGAVGSAISSLIGAALLASLYVELRTVKEGAAVESLGQIFS